MRPVESYYFMLTDTGLKKLFTQRKNVINPFVTVKMLVSDFTY